jgi:hypothetical protein
VRETLRTLGLAESPPHPDVIFDAIRPLPASGER